MNPLSLNIFGSSADRRKRGPIWVYQLVSTMKLSRLRRATLPLTGWILSAMFLLSLAGCKFSLRMPEVREFPDEFHGYAIIVWGIPGYPALPIKDGKLIETFSAGRVIITSTLLHYGVAWDENYFIRPDGSRAPMANEDLFEAIGAGQHAAKNMSYTVFSIRTGSGTNAASAALRDSQEKIQQLLEALPQQK
jgi:hypothetical protein